MVACGLLRRFGHRASGSHHKREGNPDRSAQMHPAQSPFCWASPRRGSTIAWPCQWYWMAGGKQIGVVPDCCRCIRVGQGGTVQAKQAKTSMSIPTDLAQPTAVFRALNRLSYAERAGRERVARIQAHYYYEAPAL